VLLGIERDKGKMKSISLKMLKTKMNLTTFVEKLLLIPQALKVLLMLNSEHMAPYPEWMEHVPYPPEYQIPNFFRFNAGDDALAYLVYFHIECGVRAAVEALCCKQFRYSLMGRTLMWYENFAWGSIPTWEAMVVAFLQEFGAPSRMEYSKS